MPKQLRRAKIFAVGRKAAGRNWRAKEVLGTGAVWARKAVSEIEAGWGIRVDLEIGAARVWETEVAA
jgi:hypothetical protein